MSKSIQNGAIWRKLRFSIRLMNLSNRSVHSWHPVVGLRSSFPLLCKSIPWWLLSLFKIWLHKIGGNARINMRIHNGITVPYLIFDHFMCAVRMHCLEIAMKASSTHAEMLFYLWRACQLSHYVNITKVPHFCGIRAVLTMRKSPFCCIQSAQWTIKGERVHAKWRQWLLSLLTSVLSGQDQSGVSGDRTVCISVSKSPQASFSLSVMAASSPRKCAR